MKGKIVILLAIMLIACVSAWAFISDVHTDAVPISVPENLANNNEKNLKDKDNAMLSEGEFLKSKMTLAILFLGGVGLAVFRRNSLI